MFETLHSQLSQTELEILFSVFEEKEVDRHINTVYNLLEEKQYFNKLLSNVSEGKKSSQLSISYRVQGNEEYLKKRDIEALKMYTKSVVTAPTNSEELAKAYGNRSAVLFRLGRFFPALLDVNRALEIGCCGNFQTKLLNRKKESISKILCVDNENEKYQDLSKGYSYESVFHQFDTDINDVNYCRKFPVPKFDHQQNEILPNATRKIKIAMDDKYGRHIIAAQDIQPGELILVEKPYAATLFPEFYNTHCSQCLVRCEMMIPCKTCSSAMYCGKKCRDIAYKSYHRIECEILPILLHFNQPSIFLTLRTVLIATNQGTRLPDLITNSNFKQPFQKPKFHIDLKFNSSDYFFVHCLEDNYVKKSAEEKCSAVMVITVLLRTLKNNKFFNEISANKETASSTELREIEIYLACLLLKNLCAADSNCYSISEAFEDSEKSMRFNGIRMQGSQNIGCVLNVLVSFFNHSCDRNVNRLIYKDEVVVRAIQPIPAGEQLFVEYGVICFSKPKPERQNYLKTKYYFDCACNACKFNWEFATDYSPNDAHFILNLKYVDEVRTMYDKFQNIMTTYWNLENIDHEFEFLKKFMTSLHCYTKRPSKVYIQCQELIRYLIYKFAKNKYSREKDLII